MEWRHTVWPAGELVYTATPKVANTAIKSALLETFVTGHPVSNPHADNLPYQTVKPNRFRSQYPQACHIAVVRDPFERLASFWADKIMGGGMDKRLLHLGFEPRMSFSETVELACRIPDDGTDPHLRSQAALLLNANNAPRPDLLLRFETLERDWSIVQRLVAARTGRLLVDLRRRRSSRREALRPMYDARLRGMVEQRYTADIALIRDAESPSPTTPDTDGALPSALGAIEEPLILDLAGHCNRRQQAVIDLGGAYVGLRGNGRARAGRLVRVDSLRKGRVPVAAFDGLLLRPSDRDHAGVYPRIKEAFTTAGRPVAAVGD